ncbi:MAG: YchJ family protein [Oceanicoccus sp.]
MNDKADCYCGSELSFEHCCGPLLAGKQIAQTAEQLMRSRFSAFCTENADYLVTSHHPSKRSPNDKLELEGTFNQCKWLQLNIVESKQGLSNDTHGEVEFVAIYRQNDDLSRLHERSAFVKENNHWFYLDGLILDQSEAIKLKRNDPCWCNSGKKFKKCHG